MKKISLSIVALFLAMALQAQSFTTVVAFTPRKAKANSDTIYMNNRFLKVSWSDFKAAPKYNTTAVAVTSSGFGYTGALNTRNGVSVFKLDVYCYFLKSESWVKPKGRNSYILAHEQMHLNISYYVSKLFVKKIKEATFTKENQKSLLGSIYLECTVLMNKMQADYDEQTQNGTKPLEQRVWNGRIFELIATM